MMVGASPIAPEGGKQAADRMWAVCNNSAQPYSHWGSFVARPDATIPKQLEINKSGSPSGSLFMNVANS